MKWRRHGLPAGVWALRLSGFGVLVTVVGIFFLPLIGFGWLMMIAGFITGVCSLRSFEGKLAVLISLVIIVLIFCLVAGYL